MKKYVLLYSNKKVEDNIIFRNMFPNNKEINIGWTEIDYLQNKKMVDELIKDGIEEIILAGFEIGWDKLVEYTKKEYSIDIKVICNTQDSLLYYEYERNNFFKLLELNKNGIVDCIGFFRKGQYEVYNSLGYKCYYLMENFNLDKEVKIKKNKDKIQVGIYPLNYTWDKNIFNQLCIGKMLDNCVVNYNKLDERMTEFLDTMHIDSNPVRVDVSVNGIVDVVKDNDIVVSSTFTDYVHPVFFISMEMGIPCLVGNTVDFLDDKYLIDNIVTTTEDNSIVNANKINTILNNKDDIMKKYSSWKKKYNSISKNNIKEFIEL